MEENGIKNSKDFGGKSIEISLKYSYIKLFN